MFKQFTREEAWREADKLFPTDYMKDEVKSERAGYPIYVSTADGNDSWISDLGTRLEVNVISSSYHSTTNILIKEEEPEIKEEVQWSPETVRLCCMQNMLYTCGDCRAYDKMLDMVASMEPTLSNIYKVAKDINEHSNQNTIENIMYCLNKYAIRRFYEIVGE